MGLRPIKNKKRNKATFFSRWLRPTVVIFILLNINCFVSAQSHISEQYAFPARHEVFLSSYTVNPENFSLLQQIGAGLISGYQQQISPLRLKKNTCRFKPSCSSYGLESVSRYGFSVGSLMTTDRLLRCNPWGDTGIDLPDSHYLFSHQDARHGSCVQEKYKSPILAGGLSVVPGLGKMYAGRMKDGAFAFGFVLILGYLTYESLTKHAYASGVVWSVVFGSFYLGNIYGGIDAAKNFNLKYRHCF